MEFDLPRTAALFLGLVILSVAALAGSGMMTTGTVLTMAAPSVLAFGVVCLALGVKHGEYRSRSDR